MTLRPIGIGLVLAVVLGIGGRVEAQEAAAKEPAAKPEAKPAAEAKPDAQSPDVAKAQARFNAMDFDAALGFLRAAAAKDRDMPPPQLIMATWLSMTRRAPAARLWLEKAVMEEPSDPQSYVLLADIALSERRFTEAEFLLLKANELLQSFDKSTKRKEQLVPRVWEGLATVAEAREDWVNAQKYLEAWSAADPKSAAALQRTAQTHFRQKQYDEALASLKAAAALDANSLTPEAVMARLYQAAGDAEQAKQWMEKALAAAPQDFATLLTAAQWAVETGQYDAAKKHAAAALKLQPDSPDAAMVSGNIAFFTRDYPAAEQQYRAVLQKSPSNFAATNNLALTLVQQDDQAKRQQGLEYALVNSKLYPRNVESYSTAGWAYYRMGRLEEAEQALAQAASAGSMSPDTAYYLARVLADRDRRADARRYLEAALKVKTPFAHRDEAQKLFDELR